MRRKVFGRLLAYLLCLSLSLGMSPSAWATEYVEAPYEEPVFAEGYEAETGSAVTREAEAVSEQIFCTESGVGETEYPDEQGEGLTEPVTVVFQPAVGNVTILVYGYDPAENQYTVIAPQEDGSYSLMPGEYLVDAFCDGYEPIEKFPLSVDSEPLVLPFTMTALSETDTAAEGEGAVDCTADSGAAEFAESGIAAETETAAGDEDLPGDELAAEGEEYTESGTAEVMEFTEGESAGGEELAAESTEYTESEPDEATEGTEGESGGGEDLAAESTEYTESEAAEGTEFAEGESACGEELAAESTE